MKISEKAHLKGCLKLWIRRNGELVEVMEESNLIVQKAKVAMAHLVGGDVESRPISSVAFGTKGSEAVLSDTAITDPYTKAIDSVSYPSDGQATFHFSLGSTEANGKKILEFGLLCENGDLFARRIRSEALAKEADITIDGEWTISF